MKSIYTFSFLLLLSACGSEQVSTKEKTSEEQIVTLTKAQFSNAKIETKKIESHRLSSVLKVKGKIEVPPQNMHAVSAPMGGFLRSTHLLPGMFIKKGEVIASLEDQLFIQIQQEYLSIQAKLTFAKAELNRQMLLNKEQASSDKALQLAQLEYSSLRISARAIEEKLKLIHVNPNTLTENNLSKKVNLFSPINGYVSKVNVHIGKYVNPTDVLFELVDPSDIHLTLKIFEKDIAHLAIGQPLVAYTNSSPDKKYSCNILLIGKNIDQDGTVEVHCHFQNYQGSLLPGMYMNAEIAVQNIQTNAISEEALVYFEGKSYVFTEIGARKYKMNRVELGIKDKDWVEIKEGNRLGNKPVVTKGAYTLLMTLKNIEEE